MCARCAFVCAFQYANIRLNADSTVSPGIRNKLRQAEKSLTLAITHSKLQIIESPDSVTFNVPFTVLGIKHTHQETYLKDGSVSQGMQFAFCHLQMVQGFDLDGSSREECFFISLPFARSRCRTSPITAHPILTWQAKEGHTELNCLSGRMRRDCEPGRLELQGFFTDHQQLVFVWVPITFFTGPACI